MLSIKKSSVSAAVSSLRRHANLAQVVRGNVNSGPIQGDRDALDRLDDILGRFTDVAGRHSY